MFSRKPRNQWPYINGSRGRYLLTSGLIYLMVGLSFIGVTHEDYRARFFGWMWDLWKLEPGITVGPLWVLAGVMMIAGAWRRRPGDRFAFGAAWAAPSILTFFYFVGFWFTRDPQSLLAIVVYVFFSLMSVIVSGMEGDEEREERLRWQHEAHPDNTTEGGA